MECSSCGRENPEEFSFCGHCGHPLSQICPNCGVEFSWGSVVCDRCGVDLFGQGAAAPQGERRFVVVLFADIAEFTRISETLDPEQVTQLANRCLDGMGQTVVRYGGRVEKYTGDGVVGIFGAPLSHEDDPTRALNAAIAMQEEIGRLDLALPVPPLALHIGAACGPVVAARMGSRARKEYTVIGTAVNLASRLEALSDAGQILVDEHLRHLTRHRFAYDRVTSGDEMGLEAPVFELIGEDSDPVTPLADSPLVGRAEEVATLTRCLADLQAGQGGVVSILGPAGIGKTRLVTELRRRVRGAPEVLWLEGAPPTHGAGPHGALFRRILQAARGRRKAADSLLRHLQGEYEEGSIRDKICSLLSQFSARQPVVVVLEDFHWADAASLKLVESLAELTRDRALLLFVVSRTTSEEHDQRINSRIEAGARGRFTEIVLHPLSDEDVGRLLNRLLDGEELSAELHQLIHFRSGGNPLFVEALLSAVVEQRKLRGEVGRRFIGGGEVVVVPETIRRLIQANLDRIGDEAKQVLQLAACIGYRIPYHLLSAVVHEGIEVQGELNRHLEALEDAALLRRVGDRVQDGYAFEPPLVRDTVYAGLLKEIRRRFHAAVERASELT